MTDRCLLCLNLNFKVVWMCRSVFEASVSCRCLRVKNNEGLHVDWQVTELVQISPGSYLQLKHLSTLL